jgi:putative transposase
VATVSCGGTSERYRFIKKLENVVGVKYLCALLGVSRSGYYDWCKRQPSERSLCDAAFKKLIQTIYDESEGTYGSPRVYYSLKKQGYTIGRKRVERLMRDMEVVGRVVKVTRRAPGLKRFLASGENLRHGNVGPSKINQVWVADITYLKVNKRWMYLSVIMDLFSRKIIGWSLDKNRTAEVTKRTLEYAIKKRSPKDELIFHTDRGVEYRGSVFQDVLKKHSFQHSLNRLGHCTDNGHMESFFHSMKAELIRGRSYKSEDELRYDLKKYISYFYNQKRLHSGIGYHTPMEYEAIAA